ncbi:MAG: helix-turn-helix transcriptional regulator [Candidatus Levybacteria bacterium]|nr:helix-turn-helix transcriptional regulator [Candidatus Levybacteria bacterium]
MLFFLLFDRLLNYPIDSYIYYYKVTSFCKVVTKKVYAEIPLHVEYKLTTKGESLKEIFEKMKEWDEKSS